MSETKEIQHALNDVSPRVVRKVLTEAPPQDAMGLMFLLENTNGGNMQTCECGKIAPQVCHPVK